jgi:hypothetical protein
MLLGLTGCGGAAPRAAEPVAEDDTGPLPAAEVAVPDMRWSPSALAPGTCRVRSWQSREARQASPDTPFSEYETEIDAHGRVVRYREQSASDSTSASETYRYDDVSGQLVASEVRGDMFDGTTFQLESSYAAEVDRERHVVRQTVTASDEDPRFVTYGFDSGGRLLSIQGDGETMRCAYDQGPWPSEEHRIFEAALGLPERVITYVYDRAGNLIGWTDRGLPSTAEPDGARDFVVTREGERVVVRALDPPPELLSITVYEGPCTAVLFGSCFSLSVPAPL